MLPHRYLAALPAGLLDAVLPQARFLPKLQQLSLGWLDDAAGLTSLKALSRAKALCSLELLELPHLYGSVLRAIAANCKQLTYLDVSYCTGMDSNGVAALSRLPKLLHFRLHSSYFANGSTKHVVPGLRKLFWECPHLLESYQEEQSPLSWIWSIEV